MSRPRSVRKAGNVPGALRKSPPFASALKLRLCAVSRNAGFAHACDITIFEIITVSLGVRHSLCDVLFELI